MDHHEVLHESKILDNLRCRMEGQDNLLGSYHSMEIDNKSEMPSTSTLQAPFKVKIELLEFKAGTPNPVKHTSVGAYEDKLRIDNWKLWTEHVVYLVLKAVIVIVRNSKIFNNSSFR